VGQSPDHARGGHHLLRRLQARPRGQPRRHPRHPGPHLWAELLWLERWKGLPNPPRLDESEFADIVALRDRWTVIEEHREAWFAGLGPDEPASVIRFTTTDGVDCERPLWQLVQHTANHSTYHRGQLTIFLRQIGARTVNTDLLLWDLDEEARARREAAPR
jgi:uncharacterized damage-inducible protein DinB